MLKKLRLAGFKSFAGKTEFQFEPGLTAIVGPNGCGKSNVVDAIKWVLGEQSAKSLRGTEMLDLVFSGSQSRPALGYAEATLALDNHNRRLPTDSDEVVVTRRLYRDGNSEYLLGGEPVRLRDVRELFLNTGIGVGAYSVIEQGRVDQLLQANPVARRIIFEEAAGISKYKARRRSAESKLARVEQNLLRLGDVIDEVQRQLRSIRYQAAKARRYRQYADRLQELHLAQAARDFSNYQAGRADLRRNIEDHSRQALTLAGRLHELEAQQSVAETALLELEESLARGRATSLELRSQVSRAEQAITLTERRLQELSHEEAGLTGQLERLSQAAAGLRGDLSRSEAGLTELRDRLLSLGNDLAHKREARNLLAIRRRKLEGELHTQRAAILQLTQEASQRENRRQALDGERASLTRDQARLRRRREELTEELAQLAGREQELSGRAASARERVGELHGRAQRLDRRLGQDHEERRRLQEELELARREEASKRGRLRVLTDLEAALEGVDLSTRKLLERAQAADGAALPDLRGIVAQLLSAPAEYAAAVDAALGPAAQAVVTATLDDALACRRLLKEDGNGRVQFLPLDRARAVASPSLPEPLAWGRVVGWLPDLVTTDAACRPLVDALLGDVMVVRDLEAGLELQGRLPHPLRLVTQEGELLETDGRLVLGAGGTGAGLVSRRSQIAALKEELRSLAQTIRLSQTALDEQADRLRELEASRRTLSEELVQTEEAVRRSGQALQQLRSTRADLWQEAQVLASELGELTSLAATLAGRERELTEEITALAAQRRDLEQAVSGRVHELQQAQADDQALSRETTDLQVALAQVEEQYAGLELSVANLKKSLREREEEHAFTATQLDICRQRRSSAGEELSRTRQVLADSGRELATLEQELSTQEARRRDLRQQLTQNNQEAKEVRTELDREEDELQRLELVDSEFRLKQEALSERIFEEYQVVLAEHLSSLLAEERDWDALAEEVSQLRQKLSRMGNVNLDAISEEETLSERSDFLSQQRDDLQKSKTDLERVIARINRRCRELFVETFNAVRVHFQELFRKLFGGGRADIFLADEHDVLESGIEIVAKPPGKEPKAISLLSGGEKTLTAVAILFAIFRSKPSPFCLLDEVDAAMDEANVQRFMGVLREFLQESQFIVITHCKRTMAEADVIYGITMQEPGVSTRVAVKLEEAEALVA